MIKITCQCIFLAALLRPMCACGAETVDNKGPQGTVQEIDKLLAALIAVARPVYRSFFWRPLLRDADDDMVLEAGRVSSGCQVGSVGGCRPAA